MDGYLMHCEACGTLTDRGKCDCTRLSLKDENKQRLVPFALADLRACVAAERERCAKIADSAVNDFNGQRKAGMARAIARRIRELH